MTLSINEEPKKSGPIFKTFIAVFFFFAMVSSVSAYPLNVNLDNHNYVQGEEMLVEGEVTGTEEQVNVSVEIYNSSETLMNNFTAQTSGLDPNSFSITEEVNGNYSTGQYYVYVTSEDNFLSTSFQVISERLKPRLHLISGTSDFVVVNTSLSASSNSSGYNLTDVINMSKSAPGEVHYGNTSFNSTPYHFVVVDSKSQGLYDTVYVDDDKDFELYNFSEDGSGMVEQEYGVGETFKDYMIGQIDIREGDSIFLGSPVNSTTFSEGDSIDFVVMVKNETQYIKENEPLALNLMGTGQSLVTTTNSEGYYVGNFTAPSETGSYTIEVNGTPTASITVEKFGLVVRTTDLNGNPKTSFSPGSKMIVEIYSKDENGNLADLDEMSVNATSPDGTTMSLESAFTNPSTGRYTLKAPIDGSPGTYRIDVSGTMDSETQTTGTSFEISGLAYEAMAMNPQFIDQLERGGPVKAFAPGSDITISTFLVNTSEGSMSGGPPETWGLVNMSGEDCSELITGVEVRDSRGIEYNVNYSAMSISEMAPEGVEPPEEVQSQCAVVIQASNNSWMNSNSTGTYSPTIKMNYEGQKKFARDNFGIQRLRAEGYPVDSAGNENWFQEPNSTTFVKLKVTDLETREQIDAANITSTTIIDMHREFPEYENVFDKNHLNDTYKDDLGAIKFTSPTDEGFYSMKFRFKANVSGETQEGIGKAFFDLKEYIIYGEPSGERWMLPSGQDINLTINVVDSSSGSYMFGGETTRTPTCTGCDGMTFEVRKLRNDQLNKEIDLEEYDINVSSGTVTNCSNSRAILRLSINESNPLPSGWYHMEILGNKSGKTYTGHAGFEIRDFVVMTLPLEKESGDLILSESGMPVYPAESSVLFAVVGKDPKNWEEIIDLTDASLQEVLDDRSRKPVSVPQKSVSEKEIKAPDGRTINLQVVNITGLDQGRYQANVKAENGTTSDIGTMWFTVSSYNVIPSYRGMMEHDSVFGSNENFTANFTAKEFDGNPHNVSDNCGDLKFLMREESEEPIRLSEDYYSVDRFEPNKCSLEIDISKLPSAGEYMGEFQVNDTAGVKQTSHIEFNVQDLVVSIPKMQQFWVGQVNKPTKGNPLRVNQQQDFCSFGSQMGNCSDGYCDGNYCVNTSSTNTDTWRYVGEDSCPDDYTQIWVQVNSTHASINTSGDYVESNLTEGDTFEIPGVKIENENVTWEITDIANISSSTEDPITESNEGYFGFRLANDKICGIKYVDGNGSYFTLTPPSNYSSFYFGHSEVYSRQAWDGDWLFNLSYENATVYAYHNTTHLWWNDTSNLNFSGPQGPKAVGEVINDPWGGEWEITSISEDRVSIRGVNTLPQSGAYVNTSLSKSGAFKISKYVEGGREEEDEEDDERSGFDLNGDGDTNDTIYMLLADNHTANVYDTLFLSTDRNFTDPIPLDGNRSERSFGGNWTLLNINPEGNMVRAYQNAKEEWSWLGSYRHSSNVTVPVMVNKPSGEPIENANVSITKLRRGGDLTSIELPEATTDNKGIAEVKVNLSDLGKPSGRYSFGVKAENGSSEATLEEWKWPRSVTRQFLFDTRIGEGKYVRGFKELPVYRYSYQDNYKVAQLESEAVSGITDGVFARGHWKDSRDCTVNGTLGNETSNAYFFKDRDVDSRYYYYNNSTDNLYVNRSNGCDFNTSEMTSYNVGDWLELKSMEGRDYNVSFLNVNVSGNDEEVEFGIPGINTSEIRYISNDSTYFYWGYMNNLSFGGETWNVILANASVDYPNAEGENVRKAWFSQDKNFTDATGVLIGENFTESLYLARVGPDMGRGVMVANFSNTGVKPGLGEDIMTADNLHPHYKSINESPLELDLNGDGSMNKTFHVIAFDNYQDGKDKFTTIFVDDDMNISNPWLGTDDNRFDFYSNETGMVEQQSMPPVGDTGSLWFESTENDSEEIKHWNMEVFNQTDMLLFSQNWEVRTTQNITIYNNVYSFDKEPISGANVTIEGMMKYTAFGRETLERGEDYTVENIQNLNVTDEHGASLVKIIPNGTWDQSDYEIEFTIEGPSSIEEGDMWFHVGDDNE